MPAPEAGNALVPLGDADLDDILCLKEKRVVGRDNCVGYGNRSLQIRGAARPAPHAPRRRVHEHADGRLSVFHGPRGLARYRADGSPIATT